MDNKEEKALSFRKSLVCSPNYDKVIHRTGIKQRTFSPDHDPHTGLFSPLIKNQQDKNINLKQNLLGYHKNSIQLGSLNSYSQKSSFITSDMFLKLNKNMFPSNPMKSNLILPIS